jgi:threonine/homoserine/homoserine lactone efflux protein
MAMLGAAGMGLGEVFRRVPALYDVLRIVGGAYLLWLAWCIAAARPDGEGARAGRPLSFLESALFQWVNPKAWIMAVGAVSAYAPRDALAGHVAVLALIMGVVGIACATIWAAFGSALRPLLTDARRLRLFNLAMAGLLVLSLGSLLAG